MLQMHGDLQAFNSGSATTADFFFFPLSGVVFFLFSQYALGWSPKGTLRN